MLSTRSLCEPSSPLMVDECDRKKLSINTYGCDEDIEYCNTYKGIRRYLINPTEKSIHTFKPDTLKAKIPQCYREISNVNPNIQHLHEETLFYIFYNMTGKEIQMQAYRALVDRQFYFQTKMNMFIKFNGDKVVSNGVRKITYFDPLEWRRDTLEVVFDDDFVNSMTNLKYE